MKASSIDKAWNILNLGMDGYPIAFVYNIGSWVLRAQSLRSDRVLCGLVAS
jgi:hypothetical protein